MQISLIIPTIWRSTLDTAVKSAQASQGEWDEIIVVGDGRSPNGYSLDTRGLVITQERVGDYGCSACDYGVLMASGDYVFFLGDDDYLVPNAFEVIKEGVKIDPTVPHLFAMEHTGRILKNSLECGQVSGQQIVVPRDMEKMPKMTDFPPGQVGISDYYFIKHCEQAWGRIVCHNEVIAILPRMNQGRML